MTSTKGKLRSLFLAALMVTSVFAGTVALSGSVAAQESGNIARGDGDVSGNYDIKASTGSVGDDADVFQGEEDISFAADGTSLSDFERSSGDNQGIPLEVPIPEDQPTGSYDLGDNADPNYELTVLTPRIQDLEITNKNGDDIAGGSINVDENTELTLDAQYNFYEAERLEVVIEDSNGLEVTDTILADETGNNEPVRTSDGNVELALDAQEFDNEEYTITVEGEDDLDFGPATESVTLDVTSGDEVAIDVQEDEVTRGEDVTFEVDQSGEGNTHVVAVERDDIAGDASTVFRGAGDTIDTASDSEGAYALVEIDDGVGVGSIDTAALDTTDVTVDVYSADAVDKDNDGEDFTLTDITPGSGSADDDDFEVTEGTVTLDNPTGAYVVGSETTVNGSTSAGIDDVALFARSQGDYEYLTDISVDGDDTFEEEDIVLSDDSEDGDVASDILSLPGTYRLAVVDASDEALEKDANADNDFNLDERQPTSAISEAVGEQYSLRVTDTGLTVDYVSIINGQVADDDTLSINGTAPGKNEITVSFYGPRGSYDSKTVNVDSDGTYDEDNIGVGDNLELVATDDTDTGINQGNVVMSVFSSGRDDTTGDGDFGKFENHGASTDKRNWALDLNHRSLTQQQLINVVSSQTVDDTGSDDLSEVFQFRYTDGTVSVDSVTGEAGQAFTVETNDTMTVSGTTNKQPDDYSITVEVIDGPSSSELDIESTEKWGTDGRWSVEIPTEGAEPGNYTVEASVDGNTDVRSFQVTNEDLQSDEPSEPDQNETATEPEPDEPTETTDEPTETMDEPMETTEMQEDTDTEAETTTSTGPGFTAVLALVALVAAALLAVRRRD